MQNTVFKAYSLGKMPIIPHKKLTSYSHCVIIHRYFDKTTTEERHLKKLTREKALAIAICCAVVVLITAVITTAVTKKKASLDALPAATLHAEAFDYEPMDGLSTKAMQAFVYDVNEDKFLLLKGEDKVIYPASTTKLLTALLALEYLSPDEIIVCGEEVSYIESGSSIAYIKEGMSLSVSMLIEGMLLPSGNDAAYALAAATGRKIAGNDSLSPREAIDAFVQRMNSYAEEIGLCGSNFCVPDGYYGDEHYSTIEDMMIISRLAMKNEVIMKYAGISEQDVVYESGESNTWVNTNLCLDENSPYYCRYINGLKTGSLDNYYNIICSASFGEKSYIIGLFGLEDKESRYFEAKKIAENLF